MANQKLKEFSYLAIIPRGLQSEISSVLQKQAKAIAAIDTNNDDIGDVGDAVNHQNKTSSYRSNGIDDGSDILKVTTWNEEEEIETMREALRDFSMLKKEKEKRQQSLPINKNTAKHHLNKIELEESISSEWLPHRCSVGSVKLSSSGRHVSFGYFPKNRIQNGEDSRKEQDDDFTPSLSCTGHLAGSVWMQLETNRKDVSQNILAPSRMLGPLLALVSVQTDNWCLEASTTEISSDSEGVEHRNRYQRYNQHSLKEMTKEAIRHIRSNPDEFSKQLDRALQVWRDCVETTWKDRLSPTDFAGLQNRIRDNQLRFRISCVRVEPVTVPSAFSRKRKKKFNANRDLFTYSRQELCLAIMDACGPKLVPDFYDAQPSNERIVTKEKIVRKDGERNVTTVTANSKSSGLESRSWSVNLEKFDVEMVIFITPPGFRSQYGKLAFGISLCPHSFLQSKSFGSGHVPPDVTFPYLGGDILSKGIIRLRPTTAHILLQMANLQKYDIVLDPCAGVGTIPVEVEQYHKHFDPSCAQGQNESKQFLSIGGDLILNNQKYTEVAGVMENLRRRKTTIKSTTHDLKSSSLLVAWDATHLPMRTSSVDVVVSDLPFGQQCLSVTALNQLLPLVFLECARVLTPITGRMVVLAGGSPIALMSNIEKLSGKYWKKPIPRVSPVSIGGILAWIIRVDRNEEAFDRDSAPEQLTLVRKVAQKRDRICRQRKSDSGEQQTGKRRRQSNS